MRFAVALLMLLIAMGLAACGGGDGSPAPSSTVAATGEGSARVEDQAAIRDTLERIAARADPELCTEAMTENWVDETYPPAGDGALEECRQAQKPGTKILAEGIRLRHVEIDGNEATAAFSEFGRDVGGIRGRVRLLQDGAGVWRADEVLAVTITDRDRYFHQARAALLHGSGAATAMEADCLVAGISEMSNAELERMTLANEEPISVYVDCLGGSARAAVLTIVGRSLRDTPRFAGHAGCATRRLRAALNETVAREYLAQENRDTVQAMVAHALAACGAAPALRNEDQTFS